MISHKPDPQTIIDIAIKDFGIDREEIEHKVDMRRVGLLRSVVAYILHDFGGMTYKDINETIPLFSGGTAHTARYRITNGVYDIDFPNAKFYASCIVDRLGFYKSKGAIDHDELIAIVQEGLGLTERDLENARPRHIAMVRSVVTHILHTKLDMYFKDIAPLIGISSPASAHIAGGRVLDGIYDQSIRSVDPDATSCVSYAQTVYSRAMTGGAA